MKNEDINIAIAEACGLDVPEFCCDMDNECYIDCLEVWNDTISELPDYCNDLNAMHDLEENHMQDKYDRYESILKGLLGDDWGYATARQRAEAFLRTIGKWDS